MLNRASHLLDRALEAVIKAASWLVLPVVLALFLQWPFRDALRCCSREANDLGQWIFALYIAVSLTAATRAGTHLASDAKARGYPANLRHKLFASAMLLAAIPFALFVLVSYAPEAWASILRLETFSETGNPGYFLIKLAVLIMALLMMLQGLLAFTRQKP